MRWPRLTTRRIMVLVFVLAVALGLGAPAVQVIGDTSPHVHGYCCAPPEDCIEWREFAHPPFWMCYRQRLIGRAWPGAVACGMGQGRLAETCYWGDLGAMDDPEQWHDRVSPTAAMLEARDQQIGYALTPELLPTLIPAPKSKTFP